MFVFAALTRQIVGSQPQMVHRGGAARGIAWLPQIGPGIKFPVCGGVPLVGEWRALVDARLEIARRGGRT
jgi:hypothetical protein